MLRIVYFEINLAELLGVAGKALKNVELGADAGQFARLKDARHPPRMIYQRNCASDCEFLLSGVIFVNNNVIVTLKRAPLMNRKPPLSLLNAARSIPVRVSKPPRG
jgi:hypothetical protein